VVFLVSLGLAARLRKPLEGKEGPRRRNSPFTRGRTPKICVDQT
jgi:hypothetical protein